jgi:plasmid stabilization system protein ParE
VKYRIEISSVAEAEADKVFLHLSQVTSSTKASQWYAELLQAVESLAQMPKRCSLARENEYFSQEIRQLLFDQRQNSYRVILEGREVSTIRILRIQHDSQQIVSNKPENPNAI